MFETLELNVDQPQKLVLRHPITRIPLDAWVSVYSMESPIAHAFHREIIDRRLRDRVFSANAETVEAETIELLAKLTADWSLVGLDGRKIDVPCNYENAKALYGNPRLFWIRNQVNDFVSSLGNFLPKTLTPS